MTTTTHEATIEDGAVWVTRCIGGHITARFRVELVHGRPTVVEARITGGRTSVDGLSAADLREAVAIRGVLETASPHLRGDDASWRQRLRSLQASASEPELGIALCAIGYAAAVEEGGRRVIADLAATLGLTGPQVRGRVKRARELGFLEWPDGRSHLRAGGKGVPGGRLTGLGEYLLGELLGRRLPTAGLTVMQSSGDVGTAVQLLRFLAGPPSGSEEAALVRIGPDGARLLSADEVMERVEQDGVQARVFRV